MLSRTKYNRIADCTLEQLHILHFPIPAFEQQRPSDENLPRAGVSAPWLWAGNLPTGAQVREGRFSFRCGRFRRQRSVRTVRVAATRYSGSGVRDISRHLLLHSYYSTSTFKPQTSARPCPTTRTCQERELPSPSRCISGRSGLIGTDRVHVAFNKPLSTPQAG